MVGELRHGGAGPGPGGSLGGTVAGAAEISGIAEMCFENIFSPGYFEG